MKYLLSAFVLLAALPALSASVSFSKDQAVIGQGVELIFSSDTPIKLAPDLATLQKDFKIAGRSNRQSTSIINGQVSSVHQLIYNVFPKHQGTLTVDGLTLNGEKLNPVQLTVVASQSAQNGQPVSTGALQMQAQVSDGPYYTGSSFVYTVRLGDVSRLLDGGFEPPVVSNAKIDVLGKDSVYPLTQNGQTIQVLQRRYLIIPQQSGEITINPASFVGVRSTSTSQRKSLGDLWDMGLLFDGLSGMGSQEEVFATAKPIQININPKPNNWQGWWLPSSQVTLTYSDNIPTELETGTPIERILTLSAKGVPAEALPVPVQAADTNLKVYPSTQNRHTVTTQNTIEGQLTLNIVMVPTNGGKITIPAITVPWFNITTGQREVVSVPERTITVNGPILPVTSVNTPQPKTQINPLPEARTLSAIQQPTTSVISAPQMWLWLLIGLIGGGVIVGIAAFILAKINTHRKKKPLPDLYPF